MKSPDAAPSEGPPAAKTPARGSASLAGRISSWTTRLILSGIIIVVGLGFGRQLREWWSADDAPPQSPADETMADGLMVQQISFGREPWAVERREFSGERTAAAAALVARCREIAQSSALPARPPDATELALLKRLGEARPGEPAGHGWEVRVTDQPVPTAVGIKRTDTPKREREPAVVAPETVLPQSNLVGHTARVVTWGMAVPTGDKAWALYTFQPEQQPRTAGEEPDVPLPPHTQPTLAIRSACGGAMIGFEGDASPSACQRFYEQWFANQGWMAVGAWRSDVESWFGRFRKSDGGSSQTADIRVGRDRQGRLSGMIVIGRQ